MKENNAAYKDIFREPEYRKLIFSSVINRFGDSVDAIAFTWLVYQITRNAMWSAIVFCLNTLPNVVVQPFAGALVEKMNKKKVIVFTHLLRAAVIAVFALIYLFGEVNVLIMAAATLTVTVLESFNLPAASAFTVQVVRKEHMTIGMSLDRMLSGAATLAGTGMAGLILAAWGIVPAMLIDVSTFIIAALLILSMAVSGDGFTAAKTDSHKESYTELFKSGIGYVLKTPAVRNFCILCVVLNFMLVPVNALQAPIVEEIFKMGSGLLSVAGVFASIGGIAGASLIPVLSKKLSPFKITCLGTGALGAGILGIALGKFAGGNTAACYAIAGSCFFVMMAAASMIGGVIGIQFMKSVEGEYMARASAVFNSAATAAMPAGSLIVSMAVSHIDTGTVMKINAVFAMFVLLITVITKPVLEKEEEEELADAA